jgi:hypothetical protein
MMPVSKEFDDANKSKPDLNDLSYVRHDLIESSGMEWMLIHIHSAALLR